MGKLTRQFLPGYFHPRLTALAYFSFAPFDFAQGRL
jgi:hypothetical protein